MEPYQHVIQYYETDKMGITHHSNYIRWMEEARVDFLNQLGIGYDQLEKMGIIVPVTGVSCKFKKSTTFPETIRISVSLISYRNVLLTFRYVMKNQAEQIVLEGESEHCLMTPDGAFLRLNRQFPAIHELLLSLQTE